MCVCPSFMSHPIADVGTSSGSSSSGQGSNTSGAPLSSGASATGTHNLNSPSSTIPKIVSRNVNGTLVLTSTPTNEAELQLYRVMQRASLLAYYDTLLEMGGDDVQQLCDAGEEEFLEIMALVGMASKPLHVRRLQKALQEWLTNPALFQVPLVPSLSNSPVTFGSRPVNVSPQPLSANNHHGHGLCQGLSLSPGKEPATSTSQCLASPGLTQGLSPGAADHNNCAPSCASTSPGPAGLNPGSPLQLTPVLVDSQISRLAEAADLLVRSLPQLEPKPHNTKKKICRDLEYVMNMTEDDPRRMDEIRKYAAIYGRFDCKRKPEKPLTLHEVSVNEAAAQICRFVPALLTRRDELFPLARQVVRDSGYHYSKGHSNTTECFRFSSGRSCNNGDDYHHGGSKRPCLDMSSSLSPLPGDFLELDPQHRLRRQERLEQISDELRTLGERTEELMLSAQHVRELNDLAALQSLQQQMELVQGKQAQLLTEQNELLKLQLPSTKCYRRGSRSLSCFDSERPDTDDTDSQFSFSNSSSPSQEVGDSRDSTTRDGEVGVMSPDVKPRKIPKQLLQDTLLGEGLRVVKEMVSKESSGSDANSFDLYHQENKVQVIASSGGNIIAVANPALSMSDVKLEPGSPTAASE